MSTMFVTIQGAHLAKDFQAAATVPVADLMPLLLAALSMASGNKILDTAEVWGLGRAQQPEPFPAQCTLAELDVLDGEILLVQDMASWKRQREAQRPQALAPSPQTGGIGVTWHAMDLLAES